MRSLVQVKRPSDQDEVGGHGQGDDLKELCSLMVVAKDDHLDSFPFIKKHSTKVDMYKQIVVLLLYIYVVTRLDYTVLLLDVSTHIT